MIANGPAARLGVAAACLALTLVASAPAAASAEEDPLAQEIARLTELARAEPPSTQFKAPSLRELREIERTRAAGLELLALHDLCVATEYLGGLAAPKAAGRDTAAFEAEWKQASATLFGQAPPSLDSLAAGPRALVEIASWHARTFHDASHDYALATTLDSGFLYMKVARAYLDLAQLVRRLGPAKSLPPPPALGSIVRVLDEFEQRVAVAYRAPDAQARDPQFRHVSALITSARALDAAGAHGGALNQYLDAALSFALMQTTSTPDAAALAELAKQKEELGERFMDDEEVDHGVGRIFFDMAERDLARALSERESARARSARALLTDVLPRYFAAVDPDRARDAASAPAVTVTMVRWPYT